MVMVAFFLFFSGVSFLGGQAYVVDKCIENEKFNFPIQVCSKHKCETVIGKFKCSEIENED